MAESRVGYKNIKELNSVLKMLKMPFGMSTVTIETIKLSRTKNQNSFSWFPQS